MKKLLPFLEKHVQWLVLCLALLYVGYMAYAYIVTPPVAQTLGARATLVTPATVDTTILKDGIEPMDAEIKNPTVASPKLPDVLKDFSTRLNMKEIDVLALNNPWDGSHVPAGTMGNDVHIAGTLIDHLPAVPPALPDSTSQGWTVVTSPARHDLAYASIKFKIDAAALDKEVKAAFNANGNNAAQNLSLSEFVQVELLREERQKDGLWGPPTVVSQLPIYELMKIPPPTAGLKESATFTQWMESHQDVIAHPAFLPTAADAPPWIAPDRRPWPPRPSRRPRLR